MKPKACRYPQNPEENWGPKARARTTHKKEDTKQAVDASAEEEEPPTKQARVE